MIPTDAPEHKQAQALLDKYEKQVNSKQTQEAERAHEKELMLIKADVKKAKYESEAIQKQNKDLMYAYQGFWGALGRRIIGGIDAVGDVVSDDAVSDDAVSDDAVSDDAVSGDAASDDAVSDDAASDDADERD